MEEFSQHVARFGLPFVFVAAFLEQIGAPIPAIPLLVVAGALSVGGDVPFLPALLLAVAGALIADTIWFVLGRRYGSGVLRLLCRISLSPDSCVRQTESFFDRYGVSSLLFAKFVPGFSILAPPLAGAGRFRFGTFLLYDGAGAVIWAGIALGVGALFHRAVDRVLETLAALGTGALTLGVVALVLFLLIKWMERRRFYKTLRVARITVDELRQLLGTEREPLIFDARHPAERARDGRSIPGALPIDPDRFQEQVEGIRRDVEIVLFCT